MRQAIRRVLINKLIINLKQEQMKKQMKVVMLHANTPSIFGYVHEVECLHMYTDGENPHDIQDNLAVPQHLYFTSDEEIKEGENQYYIDRYLNKVHSSGGAQYESKQQVIIATTDKSLSTLICGGTDGNAGAWRILPQIPQSFIEAYVKAEGKIDKVMLEYENRGYCEGCNRAGMLHCAHADTCGNPVTLSIIKTREDNTVKISRIKKDWGDTDIMNAVTMVAQEMGFCKGSENMKEWNLATRKWIEEHSPCNY